MGGEGGSKSETEEVGNQTAAPTPGLFFNPSVKMRISCGCGRIDFMGFGKFMNMDFFKQT